MPVTETDTFEVDLPMPTITCDREIDATREQLQEPLPNCSSTILFIGKPKSGKSSTAFSMLINKGKAYHKLFDQLHIVMPAGSRASIKSKALKTHKRVYDELTIESLGTIKDDIDELTEEGKDKSKHTLVIYDDMGAILKDGDLQREMKNMSWNRRHMNLSQWFLLQAYQSLPLNVRKVATHLYLWKLGGIEMDLIYSELLMWLSKQEWLDLQRHVYNVDKYGIHTCMFIDIEQQKMFRLTNNKYHLLTFGNK